MYLVEAPSLTHLQHCYIIYNSLIDETNMQTNRIRAAYIQTS